MRYKSKKTLQREHRRSKIRIWVTSSVIGLLFMGGTAYGIWGLWKAGWDFVKFFESNFFALVFLIALGLAVFGIIMFAKERNAQRNGKY